MPATKDPLAVLREAVALTEQGKYEEALQNHLWFHEHGLEHTPALAGVRLSFALAAWVELGQKYPKALHALTAARDEKEKAIGDGQGSFEVFHDVAAINESLNENARTVASFKVVHQAHPELATKCYRIAEPHLVAHREYAICAAHIPDALARFEEIRQLFQMQMEIAAENPLLRGGGVREHAHSSFVAETHRLIEILVSVGRRPDAEQVQARSLALDISSETREALSKALCDQKPCS